MKEVDLQRLLVEAVTEAGGFAFKMSNRFLIGVSDLFVKLPSKGLSHPYYPAGLLEVKQRQWSGKASPEPFKLDVSHLQASFLTKAHRAGTPCGVVSFVQWGTGSGLHVAMHVQTWTRCMTEKQATGSYWSRVDLHTDLGKASERKGNMLPVLYNWMKEWKDGR